MGELKVGDYIKCHDKYEMAALTETLAADGIETEFEFEKDGVKGLWLQVVEVEDASKNS
jgi:hypothetical protein